MGQGLGPHGIQTWEFGGGVPRAFNKKKQGKDKPKVEGRGENNNSQVRNHGISWRKVDMFGSTRIAETWGYGHTRSRMCNKLRQRKRTGKEDGRAHWGATLTKLKLRKPGRQGGNRGKITKPI